jgi:hypothetical protein
MGVRAALLQTLFSLTISHEHTPKPNTCTHVPRIMRTSHLLIQPLYLQLHKYKDQSLELVPNNLTIRNDGPSMDEEDRHWSMITHGGDGSKRLRIEEDAARGDFRTLKPP